MRIRLNIAYDGTAYHGWQIQPEHCTIQGELENALKKFYDSDEIKVIAAGRTDAGVHALGQVVHFDAPKIRDINALQRALSSLLPPDIQVWRARRVHDKFHARYKATERTYAYSILDERNVFARNYAWTPKFKFETDRVRELTALFEGHRDWTQFSTQPDPEDSMFCDVRRVSITEYNGGWRVLIIANRFLRKMVRTIIGTLLEGAAGRLPEEQIRAALHGEPVRVGTPAPANGLALVRVRYDIDDNNDKPPFTGEGMVILPWGEFA